MSANDKILNKLAERKVLDSEKIEEVKNKIKEEKKSLEKVLNEMELLKPEALSRYKAEIYDMPYADLTEKSINEEALNFISFEVAKNYNVVCFEKNKETIKVGIVDPDNFNAMEAINFLVQEEGLQVKYYLISELSLRKVFKQYQDLQKEIGQALEGEFGTEEKSEDEDLVEAGEDATEDDVNSAPVARVVSVIIRHAVEGNASDIHIEPLNDKTRVRYRIDGILHTSLVLPKKVHPSLVGRIKVLAKLKLDETRKPQDGRIRSKVGKREIDFRVSILPLMGEEKIVMRILSLEQGTPQLEDLGFEGATLRKVEKAVKETFGILLVCGPTGSGKSTTLASFLGMLNTEDVNISTLEDPIEYYVKGINQSQVRPEIGYSFATGLRTFLRQDPDIIMVGEIRDNETAELCIHAGLTGHFILSTLHTNNAIDAIPRMLDMNVEPYLLGSTLNMIIAQRLVRRICPKCRKQIDLPEDTLKDIHNEIKKIPEEISEERLKDRTDWESVKKNKFYKGEGCAQCGGTGYSGRTAILETIDVTDEIKEIIMDESRILKLEDVKQNQIFISMKQDGIIKVMNGDTTMEEVLRVISK